MLLDLWPLGLVEQVDGDESPPPGLDLIWREGATAVRSMADESPSVDQARLWRARAEDRFL